MTSHPQPDYDLIIAAIGETMDNLVMEFTTGYETDKCDIPIIQREIDDLIQVIRKQQESASHSSQQSYPSSEPVGEGELEYGSILPNGEDWRLRKFDGGMGETKYRIFKNEKFFAQFDNRADADIVMTTMTCQSEREKVLDDYCNIDLTYYVWGEKQSDEVGLCRGKDCNYCGRYNAELRQQGKQDGE